MTYFMTPSFVKFVSSFVKFVHDTIVCKINAGNIRVRERRELQTNTPEKYHVNMASSLSVKGASKLMS